MSYDEFQVISTEKNVLYVEWCCYKIKTWVHYSGTGATGRSSSSFAGISKPPTYNISKPSTTFDINTVTRPTVTHKAKVLYDYDATEDDELSLLADEVGCLCGVVEEVGEGCSYPKLVV